MRFSKTLEISDVRHLFAIAFDLVVADTARNHPKGGSQAYADIGAVLASYGFTWMHGSV